MDIIAENEAFQQLKLKLRPLGSFPSAGSGGVEEKPFSGTSNNPIPAMIAAANVHFTSL